ncbi:MAG: type IV toxin-antitoxin system AbiEi family antitoxin domain-containing protein [Deltaproteobacteria bacterium]|nr:type IV toxin-antitoxin system AbiEi family antitoxin domain-containing protein [Deltaproteobacteria bacterium]
MKKSRSKPKRGRPLRVAKLLPQLKKMGVFRIGDARRLGISQPTLSRLVAANQVVRLGAGLYMHPDSTIKPEEQDYVVACEKLGPDSVVGGMTALFHHGLIEQVPQRVWMMTPYSVKANDHRYRCIRTKTNPRKGVEDHGTYRITNLERTLVETFRYASKMGLRVALRATRTAVAEKRTTLQKIHAQAKALGLEKFVERHWEAIAPEGQAA